MKTDKELLMLAAKAVGLHVKATAVNTDDNFTGVIIGARHTKQKVRWNPLADDGDALRLAVDLDMDVCLSTFKKEVTAFLYCNGEIVSKSDIFGTDKHSATRRAIVRAAAAIGEDMQ